MSYDPQIVEEAKLKRGNIFAGIVRISQNITQVAMDSIDGYATPQQVDEEIRKLITEMQAKLDEVWR